MPEKEYIYLFIVIIISAVLVAVIIFKMNIDHYSYVDSFEKIIFDYSDKLSFFPYKMINHKDILQIWFFKNVLTHYTIKHHLIFKEKIYITNNFNTLPKYCSITNPPFEKLILKNLKAILKSINTKINTVLICSSDETNDIYTVLDDVVSCYDRIYISTNNKEYFNKINRYTLKKYGLGLIEKDLKYSNEYDLVIILNERTCNFFKKGKYVINLMENHPVFNCNLLNDFYEEKTPDLKNISIKKAYFVDEKAPIYKLKWKIMKKS